MGEGGGGFKSIQVFDSWKKEVGNVVDDMLLSVKDCLVFFLNLYKNIRKTFARIFLNLYCKYNQQYLFPMINPNKHTEK